MKTEEKWSYCRKEGVYGSLLIKKLNPLVVLLRTQLYLRKVIEVIYLLAACKLLP